MAARPDAIVIGSGPNGLAAAIVLARAGLQVTVYETNATIGGCVRSAALTRPGFVHDLGSAIHPFAVVSPAFAGLPLAAYGLEWIEPPAMLAHPFDDGTAAVVERSIEATAAAFGPDGVAYRRLFGTLARDWPALRGPILGAIDIRHPFALAAFGLRALQSASGLARRVFAGEAARATFAGIAAHGLLPLERPPSAAFGLVLGLLAHVAGWVMPHGGAQRLADALAAHLRSLGGEIVTGTEVVSLAALPRAPITLCDVTPRTLLRIAGDRLPIWYRHQLSAYRYGPAAFKMDWALDAPIPWRADACARAATVHIGGTLDEIATSEREVWDGRPPERPYVLLVQPTLFDPSRAPAGRHVAWAYCHVPNGSTVDMSGRIEAQIERFAPGFRDRVLARSIMAPADLERSNANLVGGDIASGATTLGQLFARPTWRRHATPVRGLYLCSSSTPPGVGVHGMCGYLAAHRALGDVGLGQ
ncbi:MAG TPA: NAD(P)/FAD-dependent oxidoreductase [Vicinamibacterales bacterium]|jgi:phytoene dehydrogenase-like protein|nr:NAD(P)/FAD-dependent oxidoreductase [Vicinamibacterales bacterium]